MWVCRGAGLLAVAASPLGIRHIFLKKIIVARPPKAELLALEAAPQATLKHPLPTQSLPNQKSLEYRPHPAIIIIQPTLEIQKMHHTA
jgi:hypothetical protein